MPSTRSPSAHARGPRRAPSPRVGHHLNAITKGVRHEEVVVPAARRAAGGPGVPGRTVRCDRRGQHDRLLANEQLNSNERLVTSNGIVLLMQGDGNLVEYAPGNRAVWASGTNRAGSVPRMQGDGNAVIIAPGNQPVWSTGTDNSPGATLELQTDGNLVVYAASHVARWANGVNLSDPRRETARAILNNPNIVLATVHVSGVQDNAYAKQNIIDTANGLNASRSSYGTAPGGTVTLNATMLSALRQIGAEGGLKVSEIAGGSHTSGSKHYAGQAFDLNGYGGRSTSTIVTRCSQLGATYAAFENGNHVHCQWS